MIYKFKDKKYWILSGNHLITHSITYGFEVHDTDKLNITLKYTFDTIICFYNNIPLKRRIDRNEVNKILETIINTRVK